MSAPLSIQQALGFNPLRDGDIFYIPGHVGLFFYLYSKYYYFNETTNRDERDIRVCRMNQDVDNKSITYVGNLGKIFAPIEWKLQDGEIEL